MGWGKTVGFYKPDSNDCNDGNWVKFEHGRGLVKEEGHYMYM